MKPDEAPAAGGGDEGVSTRTGARAVAAKLEPEPEKTPKNSPSPRNGVGACRPLPEKEQPSCQRGWGQRAMMNRRRTPCKQTTTGPRGELYVVHNGVPTAAPDPAARVDQPPARSASKRSAAPPVAASKPIAR